MLSEWGLEGMGNWGSSPHGGEGDEDVNRAQELIQSVSESGMSIETHRTTVEQSEKH